MSSTNRGSDRIPRDAYYTDQRVALALTTRLVAWAGEVTIDTVLEPSVGRGAWAAAIKRCSPRACVFGIDVDPDANRADLTAFSCGDFMRQSTIAKFAPEFFDLVLGNPPYARLEEDLGGNPTGRLGPSQKPIMEECASLHVIRALEVVRVGGIVAFLLRAGFFEGRDRGDLFSTGEIPPPAAIWKLGARPSFVGGATDSCPYEFVVWRRGFTGTTALQWPPVRWKDE